MKPDTLEKRWESEIIGLLAIIGVMIGGYAGSYLCGMLLPASWPEWLTFAIALLCGLALAVGFTTAYVYLPIFLRGELGKLYLSLWGTQRQIKAFDEQLRAVDPNAVPEVAKVLQETLDTLNTLAAETSASIARLELNRVEPQIRQWLAEAGAACASSCPKRWYFEHFKYKLSGYNSALDSIEELLAGMSKHDQWDIVGEQARRIVGLRREIEQMLRRVNTVIGELMAESGEELRYRHQASQEIRRKRW